MAGNTPPPGTLHLSWRATLDVAVYGGPMDVDGNVVVPKGRTTPSTHSAR